jgi:hypothetical protein
MFNNKNIQEKNVMKFSNVYETIPRMYNVLSVVKFS